MGGQVPDFDEDGVPIQYLVMAMTPSPNKAVSPQVQKEVLGVVEMLERKQKYQKAANLLYACVLGDRENEQLRSRWQGLIAKTNTQNVEAREARQAKEAEEMRQLESKVRKANVSALSDTKRWAQMKAQGSITDDDPNWHLGKLKPWMAPQAIELGLKHKDAAARETDPFKKVFELEEATKLFNRVLEIKQDDQARRLLGECCAAMNTEYLKMKQVKRQAKSLNPDAPMTKIGDFHNSQNYWVKNVHG